MDRHHRDYSIGYFESYIAWDHDRRDLALQLPHSVLHLPPYLPASSSHSCSLQLMWGAQVSSALAHRAAVVLLGWLVHGGFGIGTMDSSGHTAGYSLEPIQRYSTIGWGFDIVEKS